MTREINLVPDIKKEMINTLKLRNFIFFLCIVVASASVGVVIFFGAIAGGQQIAIDGKKDMLGSLSNRLNSYNDLSDFLTIKNQLGNLNTISDNKKVLSRTFNILSAIIPNGADYVHISELSVNLASDSPSYSFDAQANAGKPPFIDYNVLDSFKKSMRFMKYDYGNYVDKNGATIPAYCIIESGADGAMFKDEKKGIYALWTIAGEGCNPSAEPKDETEEKLEQLIQDEEQEDKPISLGGDDIEIPTSIDGYDTEVYENQPVVRIWRTPQYDEWYKKDNTSDSSSDAPSMDLNGTISNVPHFESACYTYSGEPVSNSDKVKWTETNESCLLIPGADEEDGISISDSSNGRDSSGDLVLRFSATITLTPEAYKFSNEHFMAIAPEGRRNVTDSYDQLQSLFTERAADCEENDTACRNSNNDDSSTNKNDESTNNDTNDTNDANNTNGTNDKGGN